MTYMLKITWMLVLVSGLAACAAPAEESVDPETDATAREEAAVQPARTAPAASQAAAPAPQAAPAPRPATVLEIPAGTRLTFTLIDSLSTETSMPGDTFEASLTDALRVDGETVLPKNALARGRVVAVDEPGRVSGLARIELTMTALQAGDQTVQLETVPYVAVAEATKTEDAAKIGAGAGIGAAIGAVLGGGKGAAVGAAIGGGSGTAVVMTTRGDQIRLPSETRVEFELDRTLRITEGAGGIS